MLSLSSFCQMYIFTRGAESRAWSDVSCVLTVTELQSTTRVCILCLISAFPVCLELLLRCSLTCLQRAENTPQTLEG